MLAAFAARLNAIETFGPVTLAKTRSVDLALSVA
jgi:hypothetical protein